MLSADELEAIRARCDAATPGPWFDNSYSFIGSVPLADALPEGMADYPDRYDRRPTAESTDEEKAEITREYWAWYRLQLAAYEADPAVAIVPALVGDTASGRHAADMAFITEARQDVPALLGHIDAQAARIADLEAELAAATDQGAMCEMFKARVEAALKPFAHCHEWLTALAEIGEIDPPGDATTIVQYSGGGGSFALRFKDLKDARAALPPSPADGREGSDADRR